MRVLLLGNGVLADALAGALLECERATLVGVLRSPSRQRRLLRDRRDLRLARRLARTGMRPRACEGVARPAFAHLLDRLSPELVLVATWPERIPATRLAAPGPRWVNCHPSLLPRWRGANPYAAAILAGDPESGVSYHLVDAGLDTGDVLLRETVRVDADDTGGDLRRRCAAAAAATLPTLVAMLADDPGAPGTPQSALGLASRCFRLRPGDACLALDQDAGSLARRVRAVQPWLSPWLPLRGAARLHLRTATVGASDRSAAPPGSVLSRRAGAVRVKTGADGSLWLGGFGLAGGRLPLPAAVATTLIARAGRGARNA